MQKFLDRLGIITTAIATGGVVWMIWNGPAGFPKSAIIGTAALGLTLLILDWLVNENKK